MNSLFKNLSVAVLKRALNIQEQIEQLGEEMHQLLAGGEIPSPFKVVATQRRKMSAAARRLIGEAQKARWAKQRGETVGQPVKQVRRKMSAAGRAKIAAAARARWAKAKAAGKSRL